MPPLGRQRGSVLLLSCSQASSPVPLTSKVSSIVLPDGLQGLLSRVLLPVGGSANSPTPMTSGSALPPTTDSKVWGRWRSLSLPFPLPLYAVLSLLLSVVTGALDINTDNTDHGCGRSSDLDMAPGSNLDLDDTVALGGSAGYSDLHDLSRGSTLEH